MPSRKKGEALSGSPSKLPGPRPQGETQTHRLAIRTEGRRGGGGQTKSFPLHPPPITFCSSSGFLTGTAIKAARGWKENNRIVRWMKMRKVRLVKKTIDKKKKERQESNKQASPERSRCSFALIGCQKRRACRCVESTRVCPHRCVSLCELQCLAV